MGALASFLLPAKKNQGLLPLVVGLVFLLGQSSGAAATLPTVQFKFFTAEITLPVDPTLLSLRRPLIEARSLRQHYRQLAQSTPSALLSALQETRQKLRLNDWLYLQLLRQGVAQILQHHAASEKELLVWYLLAASGFDARLTFRQHEVFVCAYSDEEIYEIPLIESEGRTFVNLSANQPALATFTAAGVYLLDFAPNPQGRAFSFNLRELPLLPAEPAVRELQFHWRSTPYSLWVEYDRVLVKIMENYPIIAEQEYFETPLSPLLIHSLLPGLRNIIQDKSTLETIGILVALTRSAFPYQEDKSFFGKSKPMIPDEVIHYPFSDCEDRSALFYALVKELLDLPMIIVAFPDHLTVAVALNINWGQAITYGDRQYYICDPTGPVNSSEFGWFPEEFLHQSYEIIGAYPN